MNNNSSAESKSRVWIWLGLGIILALTAAIYAELWNSSSLSWDDDSNIFSNPYFRMGMWWGVWTEPYFGLYVPITSSVWAGLLLWGRDQIWPFRLLNISLHLANITMVFVLLRAIAQRWRLDQTIAVVLATAVFALHPLQVQAVAWVSGGRDLLASFFALGAVLVYFGWLNKWGYLASFTLFVVALLSKPNVVVLPAAILIAEMLFSERSFKKSIVKMLPWFVFAAVAIQLTRAGQSAHFENTAEWWQRPYLMIDSFRFYILKTLWPSALSANYAHTPEKVFSDPSNIWKALLTLGGLALALFYVLKKDRRFLLATIWFLFLLPVSGIVGFAYENIGGVADHYNYLPLGIVAGLLLPALSFLKRWPLTYALPLVAVGGLTYLSWQRVPVWMNNTAFFMDMATTSPDSYNTALGMSIVMCEDIKDYEGGVHWTEKALAQHPNDILALANQAFCFSHAGRTEKVVDMQSYLQKLDRKTLKALQPTAYSSFLASLGSAYIAEKKYAEGFQFLCEAYRVKPSEPNHAKNVEAGAVILKRQGLNSKCEQFEKE